MLDLREQFRGLAGDVTGLPRPPASELRRNAERRRTAAWLLTTAAGVAIAAGAVLALSQLLSDGEQVLSPAPSASATAGPQPDRAWLPGPWTLVSSNTYTWAAGAPSPYRFCGESMVSSGIVAVAEQKLSHPSGQQAHLLTFTPEGEDPMQLFKFSYASCLVKGRAESVAGPRNVWSYGAVAGGSEVVGRALHLVEVTGSAEQQPATRSDAESVLDAWVP